ncbi:uncharacterized protein ACLA_078760 [Aspergillus clavatus NRRL 1]|uniref:Uncharacterized protein n=1 Tax=Aspergillus clavatus (strain ATCC 1007 / CBS 513.65 / DSM 816 / NCTC 3887 / NRRL 1 / QM 1276 / 107) TaxID=344612 RepID=A1CLZ8_ASPCL|nr:uncharacterized protein ACLA_078760 [Aspergillus clavatus NRRL 1]EAW09127.1 hypothetical protein ACLA_078760 [Aspergillus clavatus NRRL 1]
MATLYEPQPTCPAKWHDEYALSTIVSAVPVKEDAGTKETNTGYRRDVYLTSTQLVESLIYNVMYFYTDILAFDSSETIFSPTADSMFVIAARVLTADAPVTIRVHPAPQTGCVIRIYASILDQPVTVQGPDPSQSVRLELGPGTNNLGAIVTVQTNSLNVVYYQQYFDSPDEIFQATIATQLRLAQALFWQKPSIAMSLCAYGAAATARPSLYPALNAQAVALGQQLAAQAMTGPDTTYAPALTISQYRRTVEDAIDALEAFETQYERFQDQNAIVEDQKAAWKAMLQQATNEQALREQARNSASEKYSDACDTRDSCRDMVTASRHELDSARQAFQEGLLAWEERALFEGVFGLLSGIIEFGAELYGISTAFSLDDVMKAINTVRGIIDEVKAAERNTAQQDRKISSNTLKQLTECMAPLETLYFSMMTIVAAVKKCETDPDAAIPAMDDISGSSQGDADARLIITLAAWDTWTLDSVAQLDFAIAHSIRGSADYRMALQKYNINGKALAQADAQATKAGQEYVQAEMAVITCQKNIQELEDLVDRYTGEAALYAVAEAKFYDAFLSMQTSVAIQMRNMAWAYKYWALEDSPLVLDSQKSTAQFRSDLYLIDEAMNTVNSKYDRILQLLSQTVSTSDLPSNFGPSIISGLQSETHRASFTLTPSIDPANDPGFASIFTDGSHFRTAGLQAYLRGARPRPENLQNGVYRVNLNISTSGLYADIQDGKIFEFTRAPQGARVSYDITATGEIGEVHIDESFGDEVHSYPTVFTQWTIELLHGEQLDLSQLTSVDLAWKVYARFD